MAIRSMYKSLPYYPFVEEIEVELDWFGGFALSQKRKCEIGLHRNFLNEYPDERPLEVSSSSLNSLGRKLSAMHLQKQVKVEKGEETCMAMTSVESAFQSSRIYDDGNTKIGPFPEYLMVTGKESKKAVKEASMGLHSYRYFYEGSYFYAPEFHISLFYDYVYLNALLEEQNKETMLELILGGYSAFSDLATKSLNSQARSCAIFVGLYRAGLLDRILTKSLYLELFRTNEDGTAKEGAYDNVQLIKNDKIELLSPVVPCTYSKEEVETYYKREYSGLSNKKDCNEFIPYWIE